MKNDIAIEVEQPQMFLQDVKLEQALISSLMVSGNELMPYLYKNLQRDDFYNGYHGLLYDAISDVYSTGGDITDMEALQYRKFMDKVKNTMISNMGGQEYFLYLLDTGIICGKRNIIWYRDQVLKWSKARKFTMLYRNLMERITPDVTIDSLDVMMDNVANIIQTDWQGIANVTVKRLDDAATEYVKLIEDMQTKGIRLGIPEFDRIYNYILPGDVVIVIARPGVGKTNFACSQQLELWEKNQIRSILFSLEMTAARLWEREIAMVNCISQLEVQDLFIEDRYGDQLIKFHAEYSKGVYYVDAPKISLPEIENIVKQRRDISAIFIDYLSLVEAGGGNIYEATTDVAHGLKGLAKSTGTVVFCIAQTKRNGGATEEITLEMGRDSGEIEAGADVMIGLWMDKDSNNIVHASLLKARNAGERVHGVKADLTYIKKSPRLKPAESKYFR